MKVSQNGREQCNKAKNVGRATKQIEEEEVQRSLVNILDDASKFGKR